MSCAAALATLDLFEEENLAERVQEIGEIIRDVLEDIPATGPGIINVRKRGLMLAVESAHPDGSPDAARVRVIVQAGLDKGLILIGGGLNGNVLRIIPHLVITEAQASEGLQRLQLCIAATEPELMSN